MTASSASARAKASSPKRRFTSSPFLPLSGAGACRRPDRGNLLLPTVRGSGPGRLEVVFSLFRDRTRTVEPHEALPGRDEPMRVPARHEVLDTPLEPPFPEGLESAIVGMGCFWGAERVFWQAPGVYTTAVGYAGGYTPNPTYEETCSGRTGHAEVVLIVFDPAKTSYDEILRLFWENHDPTEGMRQGNDVGTQYRSLILCTTPAQREAAERSRAMFQQALTSSGYGRITTEIADGDEFFYAEPYHQQYLAKNPGGYCGLGGTGVACPVGLVAQSG